MTTTAADLDIHAVYTPEQITRLAALQGVAEFVHVLSGTIGSGVLIDLAEYVIGDDEPFDPVAEAHKAMAAIRFERGEGYGGYDDGEDISASVDPVSTWAGRSPLADWERELLGLEARVVGDITVSDLAGFLTLPTTAVLLDHEGDTWLHVYDGWSYGGAYSRYTPEQIFEEFDGGFDFIVTNPEVLS